MALSDYYLTAESAGPPVSGLQLTAKSFF